MKNRSWIGLALLVVMAALTATVPQQKPAYAADVHYHFLPPCKSSTPACPGYGARTGCIKVNYMGEDVARCDHQ